MGNKNGGQAGVTLVELVVVMFVFLLIALGFLGLYSSLMHSSVVAKRQAVGLTLATNQMEYLRSVSYDDLAVSGGSIISPNYLPAATTKVINGATYRITTSISYVDDAYDGCTNYPNATLKSKYCRGYSTSTTTTVDTNPADYKIANVSVTVPGGTQLASVDTQFAARVAETASTTGALFMTVVDNAGAPLKGATVQATNSTVSPGINVSDTTDDNGLAIFYGLPVDTVADYVMTASKNGYSTLKTIGSSGSLQPTYPNLTILSQQSSSGTLVLRPMGTPSLLIQATDVAGNPLVGAKIHLKGGYKNYTLTSNTAYYFDTMTGGDTRPITGSGGEVGISNLVPGPYYFCGDTGATSCSVGGTTYYLAAAVPYSGSTALNPVTVPTYNSDNPPTTMYPSGATNYLQKVQLMLTTNANFPRVSTLTPSVVNKTAGNINSLPFTITGANLPCSSTASSCATTVRLLQGSTSYAATCTGASAGTTLNCRVNLAAASVGGTQLVISTSSGTLTLPASPQLGGIDIDP